jgi:hypothetical protein
MHTYLFVLSPPYCGSTVLWRLLATSLAVSTHPTEGLSLDEVKHIMSEGPKPWDPQKIIPWMEIKEQWEQAWDMSKPILLEKSPPNIVWALDIEKVFQPAYFIAIMRDPYAFCEGRRRRHKNSEIRVSAEFWANCAGYQRRNIEGLKNITHFKYEDFADSPMDIRNQILSFLPELQDIDVTQSFKARSIQGRGEQKIRNFNQEKIDRLSVRDIREINAVLEQHDQLMTFFGYKYLEPSAAQSVRHLKSTVVANTLAATRRAKRLKARLSNLTP